MPAPSTRSPAVLSTVAMQIVFVCETTPMPVLNAIASQASVARSARRAHDGSDTSKQRQQAVPYGYCRTRSSASASSRVVPARIPPARAAAITAFSASVRLAPPAMGFILSLIHI